MSRFAVLAMALALSAAVTLPVRADSVGIFDGQLLLSTGERFDGSAVLDLGDHDLIVTASAANRQAILNWVTALVKAKGITSSQAGGLKGLAVALNDNGAGKRLFDRFDSIDVDINTILVKFTWTGDANFDGVVNADDYFKIDAGFVTQPGGYINGDFNYDGVINADDYFLIDSAFGGQNRKLTDDAPVLGAPAPPDNGLPLPIPPAAWGGIALFAGLVVYRSARRFS